MNVARFSVLLLFAVNLVLFAWGMGYLGERGSGEPERLAQQLAPERLRIVSTEQPVAPAPDTAAAGQCREYAGLGPDQADRLAEAARAAGLRVSREPVADTGYRVFLIARSPEQAQQEVLRLRRLNIAEAAVAGDAARAQPLISLGLFASEQAARDRLAELQRKGVADAQLGANAGAARETVRISGAAEALAALARKFAAAGPALSSTQCRVERAGR